MNNKDFQNPNNLPAIQDNTNELSILNQINNRGFLSRRMIKKAAKKTEELANIEINLFHTRERYANAYVRAVRAEHQAKNVHQDIEREEKEKQTQDEYAKKEMKRQDIMSQAKAEHYVKKKVVKWAKLDNEEKELLEESKTDNLSEEERRKKKIEDAKREIAEKAEFRKLNIEDGINQVKTVIQAENGFKATLDEEDAEKAISLLERLFLGDK